MRKMFHKYFLRFCLPLLFLPFAAVAEESKNLLDHVPEAKDVTFLNHFQLHSVTKTDSQIIIEGKVNSVALTLKKDTQQKHTFSIEGKHIALESFFKDASHIPLIKNSTFDKIAIKQDDITIDANYKKIAYKVQTTRAKQKYFKISSNDLTLEHLDTTFTDTLPFLKTLALKELSYEASWLEATFSLGDTPMKLAREKGSAKPLLFYSPKVDASSFIPTAKNSPADSLVLSDLFLIYNGATQTMKLDSSPEDLKQIAPLGKELQHGLNLFGVLDLKTSKGLKELLQAFGVAESKLPIEGTLSKESLAFMNKKNNQSADTKTKQSLLKDLNVRVTLPKLTLPNMGGISAIHTPTLELGHNDLLDKLKNYPQAEKKNDTKHTQTQDAASLFFAFNASLSSLNLPPLKAAVHIDNIQSKEYSVMLSLEKMWNNPLGVNDILITEGIFTIKLANESKTVDLIALADVHNQKNIYVEAEITKEKEKLTLAYFDLQGKFTLDSFIAGKEIPHAKEFELDEIKITPDGIEAKTVLKGKKVDCFLFKTQTPSWVFAIEQKDFKITELLPKSANNKLLSQIKIPNAALILSNKGFENSKQNASVIQKELFKDIFQNSDISFKLDSGVALIAEFDPKSMGVIGKGLEKIGVHEDAIIVGEVLGVFDGVGGFELELLMQQHNDPAMLPKKAMNFSKVKPPSFFFKWQGEDIYVGADVGMDVKAGKETLFFHTTLELEFNEKGIGADILGSMDGTWHKPFKIEFLSLSDLKLKVGINDLGEAKIGFAGKETIGTEVIDIAAETTILLEDALPDGIAFSGKIKSLGINELVSITEALLKQPQHFSKIPLPYFEIQDALLAFATPGATDPQLGLVSEGFAFGGEFFFLNRRLGKVFGSGGPQGTTLKGDIQDFDLDIVSFKKNNVDIALTAEPKIIINSTVKLLDDAQAVKVDFQPPHFEFEVVEKLAKFGLADITVRMDGVDLQTGKFDQNADISIIGEFHSTLIPWIKDEIHKGMQELTQSATQQFENDKKALDAAMAKVSEIDKKIEALKAQDDKSKKRAQDVLNKAQSRVHDLKSKYDHAKHMSGHCGNKWTHWACKGYWIAEADAIWISYKVAEGVLQAAKEAVAAAFALDPRILELKGEKDIAMAALIVAKSIVEVSELAEKFVLNELDAIVTKTLDNLPFEIQQTILIGDLKDMIQHDDPLVLDLQYKILDNQNRDYFAIKLKDPAFDAVSFGLLPVMMLDQVTESVLKKADPKIAKWLHAHMAQNLANAQEKVRQAVEKEEAKYKNVLLSYENGSKKYQQAYEDRDNDRHEFIAASSLSDFMPQSKTFNNTYLAVGHSQLCLGVATNGIDVQQEDCKDIDAERWSTVSLDDGYVQLKTKGGCLKAKNKDAKEEQPLILAQCDKNDAHEQWKIISEDGFYDKIINRFSQKCLHFDTESANPKTAFAVWTSCVGADSQMFREIETTKRPTWHEVKKEIEAKNGSCLAASQKFESYFDLKGKYGHLDISKASHEKMKRANDDVLYSAPCKSDETEFFNYLEDLNGDIKLVHAESGWCVAPKHDAKNSLILAPCDDAKDMWWSTKRTGDAFALANTNDQRCIDLETPKQPSNTGIAKITICNRQSLEQTIDFVK